MTELQISDFDINLIEPLLVHKNTFVHRFKWIDYRSGRLIDGFTHCISGRAVFDYGDFGFELCEGQSVFLPATSSYVVRCESREPFVHYTANFRLGRENTTEQTVFGEVLSGRRIHVCEKKNAELFAERFEKLLLLWQSKRNGYRVMAKSILYEILYLYFTDAGRSLRNHGDYEKLLPARRLLDAHFDENQTVTELAELCGISETHFRRLFLRLFGMTPIEYRTEKRILKAKDLLMSGQYSVSETAEAVGFSDPNYFTRIFRSRTGESPSEFIRYS